MKSTYFKPIHLLAFIVGMFAMLLLIASLPVSFHSSTGYGGTSQVPLNSGTYQISIRGIVPVICRVSLNEKTVPAGGVTVDLGEMTEFCNSAGGYIVFVDHTPNVAGAIMIVDGRRIELSPHGSTAIFQSDKPGNRSHKLSLDLMNHPAPKGGLSFRILPL